MSGILVLLNYAAGVVAIIAAAFNFADQYHQPWLPLAVIAGCCFLTAHYIARGMR